MKKLYALILCLALMLASCGAQTQSESSSEVNRESESFTTQPKDEVSSSPVESSSNTTFPSESNTDTSSSLIPTEKYITLPIKNVSSKPTDNYLSEIAFDFGAYVGGLNSDLDEYGDFYKIIKSYDEFASDFTDGQYIEKELFNDYFVLVVDRHYGGKYSRDFGFRNFRIDEDGIAKIDHTSYTGDGWFYNDCEFGSTNFLLIPRDDNLPDMLAFQELDLTETEYYSNSYSELALKDITLKDEVMFIEAEQYRDFCKEQDLYYSQYFSYNNYIIMPKLNAKILTISTSLAENKLKINIEASGAIEEATSEDKYYVISLNDTALISDTKLKETMLNSNTEIEVITHINERPFNIKELTAAEWNSALSATLRAENYTSNHYINFKYQESRYLSRVSLTNMLSSDRMLETARLITSSGINSIIEEHRYVWDYKNAQTYYKDGESAWIIENGISQHKCYDIIDPLIFKDAFENATIRNDGIYYIDSYAGMHDIKIKIANGYVVYIEYKIGDNGDYKQADEHHEIYYRDYGTTQIPLPEIE